MINKIDPHGMGDDSQWFVERNDHDFYILKEKLIEFHGELALGDFIIPAKRYSFYLKIYSNLYTIKLIYKFCFQTQNEHKCTEKEI